MSRAQIQLTVDAVVYRITGDKLKVLLIKRKNDPFKDYWALPGGFVEAEETLEQAAKRELREETSLEMENLTQLYAFGDPGRDPRGRVVSVAFFGIAGTVPDSIKAADDASDVRWFDVRDLPPMAFDHGIIIQMANENYYCFDKNRRN